MCENKSVASLVASITMAFSSCSAVKCAFYPEILEYSVRKSSMPPTLYYVPFSAPCRAVLMAAKALGVVLELKLLDLQNGENMTPEFLKLNPQHTVPTLVEDSFSIWESRAIITYLANEYGKRSPLYPEDPKGRALVDQRLFFELGTVYERFSDYFFPQAFAGQPADPEKRAMLEETLQLLDILLEDQEYFAGDNLTLADISLVVDISDMEASDIDFLKYNNIRRWYDTVKKTAPGYEEINEKGLQMFKDYICMKKKKRELL